MLTRIPRELLHVGLDDLSTLGVPDQARAALRALLADLPRVPDASLSAQLIGSREVTLPCLAVLARHAGLKELVAEVLPENTAMLKLFKKFGFRPDSKRSPQVVHLTLQLS